MNPEFRHRRIALMLPAAAVFLSIADAGAQESRLGRLFFSPEERQKLDAKRGARSSASDGSPQMVVVNGYVARSGRDPILFMNGREVAPDGSAAGVTLRSRAGQALQLQTEGSAPIVAKPGQMVDLANGRAIDGYQFAPSPTQALPAPAPSPTPGNKPGSPEASR